MDIKKQIQQLVEGIAPLDVLEQVHKQETLVWIASGAEVFRLKKPDTPPRHLVSYFVVVDGEKVLLVDHKSAQSWLPTGGHVELNEHPKTTVERECLEELFMPAEFLYAKPLMLTLRETVGKPPYHEDVSLWYVLKGDSSQAIKYDEGEFNSAKWFHFDDIPQNREPNISRLIEKLKNLRE